MPLAEIHVTLKPALFDAQGETIKKALHQLGHAGVQNARIGKYITLEIEGADAATLQGQLDLMCQQLLANPVIEDYEVSLPSPPTDALSLAAPAPVAFDPIRDAAEPTVTPTPFPLPTQVDEPVIEAVTTSRVSGAGVAATVSGGPEAVTTSGGIGIADPFTVDFRSYQGMPTEAKLALRTLALRKHGAWIEKQLAAQRAAWVLCVGHEVVESGLSLDTYPTDQHLLKMGVQRDLVPWVFTRPTA
ncbi:MAG: phosphoribosylformylglycinamidine synthase subunit PurS [Armatimonadetes bacterium]|nr:phosphoribosylformylglycinamidine synthase subunit PurS [Armatimonadota bacterium]